MLLPDPESDEESEEPDELEELLLPDEDESELLSLPDSREPPPDTPGTDSGSLVADEDEEAPDLVAVAFELALLVPLLGLSPVAWNEDKMVLLLPMTTVSFVAYLFSYQ